MPDPVPSADLPSCPFCGALPALKRRTTGQDRRPLFWYECSNTVHCGVSCNLGEWTEEQARAKWIRREPTPCIAEVERCLAAVEAEPDLPGEMPDDLFSLCTTKAGATQLLRQTVRSTKRGIHNRIIGRPHPTTDQTSS